MKKQLALLLIALSFLFAMAPGTLEANEWSFDKAHSNFYFEVKHIFASVRGNFTDFSGTLVFDPDKLAESRVEVTVNTQSVETQITKRDNHLRSKDFLAVSDYPTMTFKSRSFTHRDGLNYSVTGDLTIKDVTKTIAVPFVFYGAEDNPLM